MEWKADGLLLRAADYGENDRMVTLLTAERGKVSAAMKGVRKAGAKLRFASQPFCFAEYVFAERNGRMTVTEATLHDGFYGLRTELSTYYAAAAVVEVADVFSGGGLPSGPLLVAAVHALGGLERGETLPTLLNFMLTALTFAGYPVSAAGCAGCGGEIDGNLYFDMSAGAFLCPACAKASENASSVYRASLSTYDVIRAHTRKESGGTEDGYRRALRLLRGYASYHADHPFPALLEFLRL